MLRSLINRISWLSLDVVFGGLAGMYFFSRFLRVEIEPLAYLLLGMSIWGIYTLDHLIDARKIPVGSTPDRHQFHIRNKGWLSWLLVLVLIAGLVLGYLVFGKSLDLLWAIFLGVLILGIMAMLRKFSQKLAWLKEISTAFFYVLGISWLPIWNVDPIDLTWEFGAIWISYFVLALLNLLMLTYQDKEKDKAEGSLSLLSFVSQQRFASILRGIVVGLILGLLLFFLFALSFYKAFIMILLAMAVVHYLSFYSSKISVAQSRQQMELSFLLPAILFFI